MRATFPERVERATAPVGRLLARTPLQPNHVTTLGFVLTGAAALLVATDRPVAAGVTLAVGGLMDTFDGALARARGSATPFGAFYDAATDRLSDGVILAGLAWWLRDDDLLFGLVLVALVTAQVTSYVRARAESIDLNCSVGLLERAERMGFLVLGLLWPAVLLKPVLWLLAVGGVITVAQRMHHVWCQIDRDVPPELVGLISGDRVWDRAFLATARSLFGQHNIDDAIAHREQQDDQVTRP